MPKGNEVPQRVLDRMRNSILHPDNFPAANPGAEDSPSVCDGAGAAPSPRDYERLGQIAGGLSNAYDPYGVSSAAGGALTAANLYDFRRGGPLDAQVRYKGSTPYANYVFGVYAAAAGISLAQALTGANDYAARNSRYPADKKYDEDYRATPATNVQNIIAGYRDQKSASLCRVADR
jgi:hypothetical protein